MLNNDRKYYVTASQCHRVMAEFEGELAGKQLVEPEFENFLSVAAWIHKNKSKPLVGDLKQEGIKASGADIKQAWDYIKAQTPIFSEGMETVAREIAMSYFIEERDGGFKSLDMERGNQQEGEAVQYLADLTGIEFTNTEENQTFFTRDSLGVTPDGLEMDGFRIKSCAEVKNPMDKTHMKYLSVVKNQDDMFKNMPEYYWQAQCGIYVTECESYHWLSYHNRFLVAGDYRGVYVNIKPNPDHVEIMVDRANRVLERVPEIIKDIIEDLQK